MPRYELDGETWEIVQEAQLLHLDASGKQTTRKFVSPGSRVDHFDGVQE